MVLCAIHTNLYALEGKAKLLLDHLKQTYIPETVKKLALKGYENYKTSPLLKKLESIKVDQAPGARDENWIFVTFGVQEAEILKDLEQLPAPLTWTVEEINLAYQHMTAGHHKPDSEKAHFILVNGVGISGLHRTKWGKNSIVQLASQFNYLESTSSDITNVSSYIFDWTQGPLGAIEAAAATLHRHAAVTTSKLPHALYNVLQENVPSYYKNGYLTLSSPSKETKKLLLNNVNKNISKLEILPQWVICESSGSTQLQVFSAAPSFQGSKMPEEDSLETEICKQLVAIQYEAIAKLAVLQSILLEREIPLHLTLIGQGAFNNPPSVIAEAFNKVANIVKGYDVKVFIHVFGDDAKNKFLQAKTDSFTFEEMSRETFINWPKEHSETNIIFKIWDFFS